MVCTFEFFIVNFEYHEAHSILEEEGGHASRWQDRPGHGCR